MALPGLGPVALPGLGPVALPGLGPVAIVGSVVPRQIARRLAGGDEVVGGHAIFRVGQLDVVHGRAGRLEDGERLLDPLGDLGVEPRGVVLRDAADPHAGERLLQELHVVRHLGGE